MSGEDEGGGGGGKGGGGGDSKGGGGDNGNSGVGFSPTGAGVNAPSNADLITAPPSAIPLFNASSDISASDGSTLGGTSAGTPSASGASTASQPPTQNLANSNTTSGVTAPAAGGVGATSIAPVAGNIGGTPSDLTTDLSARSNTGDSNFPNGVPLPPTKPAIPGQDQSLDNLAAGGTPDGGATGQPQSLLSPDQLGKSATTSTSSTGTGSTANKSGGGVLDSLGIKNPAGTALAAAGLGYSVLNGQNSNAKQASQLAPSQLQAVQDYLAQAQAQSQSTAGNATAQTENAKQLYQQGQNLVQYLQTGTLPPDAQASLDQATASAKAAVKSRYAAQGLNTDPTQNSVLNQELQQIDQQAIASKANLEAQYQTAGAQLIQASQAAAAESEAISNNITASGTAAAGLSSDLYKTLIGIDQTSQAQIGTAIANFAKSVSGSGGGTTINLGGTSK